MGNKNKRLIYSKLCYIYSFCFSFLEEEIFIKKSKIITIYILKALIFKWLQIVAPQNSRKITAQQPQNF